MAIPYLYLRQSANQNGTHAIMIGLSFPSKHVRLSLKKYIKPEKWDERRQCVKGSGQDVNRLNLLLAKKLALANQILTYYELLDGIDLSPELFIKEFKQPASKTDFLVYYQEACEDDYNRRLIAPATYDMEQRTLRKLKSYQPIILFSFINRKWIEKFDVWHTKQLVKKGYVGNGERSHALKHIRKYLNRAKQDGKIFVYPFTNFKWPQVMEEINFLTEEMLRDLIDLRQNDDRIMEGLLARAKKISMFDWNIEQYANEIGIRRVKRIATNFLIQCFTGMRYSDLQAVTWFDNVIDDRLQFVPIKTKNTTQKTVKVRMKLNPIHYDVFRPIKDNQIAYPLPNSKYNKHLKELGDILGLPFQLHSHIGRHTFATLYLTRGGKIEELKDLMGVTKLETVMVYVHITRDTLDTGMDRAWGSF